MTYLVAEIWIFLAVVFAIGLVAGRLLRALRPATGAVGDRAAMAESLATVRETEARHLRSEVDTMKERLRIAEAESAAAQADVARTGVQLNTTRTDLSRKIVSLEEEIAALKKPRPVAAPTPAPAPPAPVVAAPVVVAAPKLVIAPEPAVLELVTLAPLAAVSAPAPMPTLASVTPTRVLAPAPIAAPPASPLASLPPDDLKEIVGIGPILEHTLQSLGLKTFAQIASITPEDVAMLIVKVDSSIAERVLRERWVEQARDLYAKKYGQAA